MSNMKAATRPESDCVRYWPGAVLAVGILLTSAAVHAQSSSRHTVTVPFASAGVGDGYESGSVGVTYAFIACQGEMHIAYSLNEGSATAAPTYRLGGKAYPATGAPPQPATIRFAGTVHRGPQAVGSFADGLTGKALGMGCFSGQTQKIANIADVVGPKATADQVSNYFNSLRITVEPANTLRSAAQESRIRGELRRAEAEAAAATRKAEQEAQAKAKEAEQRASAESVAKAQQAAATSTQAQSTVAGTGVPATQAQTAPLPLTRDERVANAIASDKVLADQRLEQQRAAFAQQQAAMAAAQQRQTEAMIAVAPAAIELGGSLYGALEAWDARWKARRYQAAQAKLVGMCQLPNGMAAPKDGDIRLGIELTADLGKDDCGHNPGNRYKAFKLELSETTRLQFTIKAAKWRHIISYQIDVRDAENRSHMFMGWEEWGAIQKVNSKNVELPAGLYIVTVSNGTEDIFAAFDLRVDPMGPDWKPLAVAPPAAQAAPVAVEVATPAASVPVPTTAAAVSPGALPVSLGRSGQSGNYLGLTIDRDGEAVVVSAVDPGSPAAGAGLQRGDVVQRIGAQKGLVTADVAKFTDQAALDAWLAVQKRGARTAIVYRRAGKMKVATLSIGTRP